jgi:TRAP-type C4-dicarboxylate transport system substrate-binding protein
MGYANGLFSNKLSTVKHGVLFADAVRIATGGEVDITVHPGGSLFKGNDIKKAVQTGQAPIGERLLSAHQNESLIIWGRLNSFLGNFL